MVGATWGERGSGTPWPWGFLASDARCSSTLAGGWLVARVPLSSPVWWASASPRLPTGAAGGLAAAGMGVVLVGTGAGGTVELVPLA